MKKIFVLLGWIGLGLSAAAYSQTQVLTPELIAEYGLDFSSHDSESKPYELVLGSQALIDQGVNVVADALYLKDNASDSYELISKTLQGGAALITNKGFDATPDFERIVFISADNNIVDGDVDNETDAFIFERSTGRTTQVNGRNADNLSSLAISQDGQFLIYSTLPDSPNLMVHPMISYEISTQSESEISLGSRSYDYVVKILEHGDRFSVDGRIVYFGLFTQNNFVRETGYYNFDSKQARSMVSVAGYPSNISVHNLSDTDVVITDAYVPSIDDFGYGCCIYIGFDLEQAQQYAINGDPNYIYDYFSPPVTEVTTLKARTKSGRYAVFAAENEDAFYSPIANSGRLWVLDTHTRQTRPAFAIARSAFTHNEYRAYYNNFGASCDVPYVLSPASIEHSYSACISTDSPALDEYTLAEFTTLEGIRHTNVESFDISPAKVQFHNSDRYISFEGNSWYLDNSIAYEDFLNPQYQRNTFVVVNPFLKDLPVSGRPVIDRANESGVYVWQDSTGRTHVEVVAGGTAQRSQFVGSITTDQSITEIIQQSIESDDSLNQVSQQQINFDLNVASPWRDSFSFMFSGESLCIDVSQAPGGLFVGPDKIAVEPPYDIAGLKSCDAYQVPVDGKPDIDRTKDVGWFIWRQHGQWRSEFVSGSDDYRATYFYPANGDVVVTHYNQLSRTYQGTISASSALGNIIPVSIESDDELSISNNQINFTLNALTPWMDGFRFTASETAQVCVSLEAPAYANVYLGPDRIQMPQSFDLNTLDACDTHPGLVTLGRPLISRSSDNGIFLWENASNQWEVEVVSGSGTRRTNVDVNSDQQLSNVSPVSIEASDVFITTSNSIESSLSVTPPWRDGFRFTVQANASSCVSTTNAQIFVGPDRTSVGSDFNLLTQGNCN